MNGNDAQCNPLPGRFAGLTGAVSAHRRGSYQKVLDGRKQEIRGLWIRNGNYYARLTVKDPATGARETRRVRLDKAHTVAEAREALHQLQCDRRKENLPTLRVCPKFSDYQKDYLARQEANKRPRTLVTEKSHLNAWVEHLGETRLNHITPAMIDAFIAKRQAEGASNRTINLALITLRNVLKRAKFTDRLLHRLPTENVQWLKYEPRKKELFKLDAINRICEAAAEPHFFEGRLALPGEAGRPLKNAQSFADYVRLMAFCGSRMTETLHIKWTDIDWDAEQIIIRFTKNGKERRVDFNPRLEEHLRAMRTRRAPDSQWLFPSPQRGEKDLRTRTFRESLLLARAAAKLLKFGFHDCRHFFCSYCVMSGIDYMTIAQWAGHLDGGVLIGKVYGHLADEHKRQMARKVRFTTSDEKASPS